MTSRDETQESRWHWQRLGVVVAAAAIIVAACGTAAPTSAPATSKPATSAPEPAATPASAFMRFVFGSPAPGRYLPPPRRHRQVGLAPPLTLLR